MKFLTICAIAATAIFVPFIEGYCTKINQAGLNLISEFEGFVPSPKPDPVGKLTVGYGHLCQRRGCSEVPHYFPLTKHEAQLLLNKDLTRFTRCLAGYISNRVKLNQNQWAALVSWTFNEGCGQVKTSSLVRRLNKGQTPNTVAAQELPKWKYAGGRVMPGLVRRRAAEVRLFRTHSPKEAHPNCQ